MKYQAVFFDFDYTLGDSTYPITEGFKAGFAALGLPAPTVEQVRPTIGMTLENAYTFLTGDEEDAHRKAFTNGFHDAVGPDSGPAGQRLMTEETQLFPGTAELLRALQGRGVKVAIISTKPRVHLERIFAYRGLSDTISLIVGGSDVSHHKPHPEGVEYTLGKLHLTADQVLFCGDTVIDAQTAANGKTDFCAVLNGTTPAEAFEPYPHVHVSPDLLDLRQWLEL